MPNYTFEDTETGEQFVEFMPMDSKEKFLEYLSDLEQALKDLLYFSLCLSL